MITPQYSIHYILKNWHIILFPLGVFHISVKIFAHSFFLRMFTAPSVMWGGLCVMSRWRSWRPCLTMPQSSPLYRSGWSAHWWPCYSMSDPTQPRVSVYRTMWNIPQQYLHLSDQKIQTPNQLVHWWYKLIIHLFQGFLLKKLFSYQPQVWF